MHLRSKQRIHVQRHMAAIVYIFDRHGEPQGLTSKLQARKLNIHRHSFCVSVKRAL